jgi:hypothetical protein
LLLPSSYLVCSERYFSNMKMGEYGVGEYVGIIMGLIQQESGGRHLDVMQSSGVTRFSINAFA